MKLEMGESLFYSWLRHVKGCQIVQTNWKISSSWQRKHDDDLEKLKNESDKLFSEKHNYNIYKKNANLDQLITQGECDVIGISIEGDCLQYYAVDVAFHEKGLNYGSRKETVSKVIAKSLRTAMCLYGYFDTKAAEIVFASPKINPSILHECEACKEAANKLLKNMGFDFHIRIIANEEFKTAVMDPILKVSGEVSDTAELFMRSYQLYKMFSNEGVSRGVSKDISAENASKAISEVKVGVLAKTVLRQMLEKGVASQDEIEGYQTLEKSKAVFKLGFPLLVPIDRKCQRNRYYSDPIVIRGKSFWMTSQWYEAQKKPLNDWIEKHQT